MRFSSQNKLRLYMTTTSFQNDDEKKLYLLHFMFDVAILSTKHVLSVCVSLCECVCVSLWGRVSLCECVLSVCVCQCVCEWECVWVRVSEKEKEKEKESEWVSVFFFVHDKNKRQRDFELEFVPHTHTQRSLSVRFESIPQSFCVLPSEIRFARTYPTCLNRWKKWIWMTENNQRGFFSIMKTHIKNFSLAFFDLF